MKRQEAQRLGDKGEAKERKERKNTGENTAGKKLSNIGFKSCQWVTKEGTGEQTLSELFNIIQNGIE